MSTNTRIETRMLTQVARGDCPNWLPFDAELDSYRNSGWNIIGNISVSTLLRVVNGQETVFHYRHINLERVVTVQPEPLPEQTAQRIVIEDVGPGITITPKPVNNGRVPVEIKVIQPDEVPDPVQAYKMALDAEVSAPFAEFFDNLKRVLNTPLLPLSAERNN